MEKGKVDGLDEASYERGWNQAHQKFLGLSLQVLAVKGKTPESYALERSQAITTLRMACDDYGDNDWPDDLHLSDIIEKHLVRYFG